MVRAGGGNDEYGVRAGDLNQSFIGLEFGYNEPSGSIRYARVASIRITRSNVQIMLDGMTANSSSLIEVPPTEILYFSHASPAAQLLAALDRLAE